MTPQDPWYGPPAASPPGTPGYGARPVHAGPPGYGQVHVPRIDPARRTAALARWAAVEVVLALLVGVGFAVAGDVGATLALLGLLGWLAGLVRYIVVRQNRARELAWDGRVLAGRTTLGWHGVDLWQVTAVEAGLVAGEGPDIDTLALADAHGHLLVRWKRLAQLPGADGVRSVLLTRQAQGLRLPGVVCAAWQVAPLPSARPLGRVPPALRRRVDLVIDVGLVVASLLAVPLGVLLGLAF